MVLNDGMIEKMFIESSKVLSLDLQSHHLTHIGFSW
jgi:hypothetical protein